MKPTPMKLLLLTTRYPRPGDFYYYYFVHSRAQAFLEAGHEVEVLSFQAGESYTFENVRVSSERDWLDTRARCRYDAVVSHSPGVRKHLPLLRRRQAQFRKILLVLNGAEGMLRYKYNLGDYSYRKNGAYFLRQLAGAAGDHLRLRLLRSFILEFTAREKLKIIHTSPWMKKRFLEDTGIPEARLRQHMTVIPNPIGEAFLRGNYSPAADKLADFVTIRPLNEYRYGIDIVWEIARTNPAFSFHIYGRGDFFRHVPVLPNMRVFERFIPNAEIPALLDRYRAALMPTRSDTQGIMACEMATYGIPLVTSGIESARAALAAFPNVHYIDNHAAGWNAAGFLKPVVAPVKTPYARANTVFKEMKYIHEVVNA